MKFRNRTAWLLLTLVVGGSSMAAAQTFQAFPGSKLDEKASKAASAGKSQSQVYTTPESFERLYNFYKGLYKEVAIPPMAPKLPSGEQVKWAFFILDGEKDLVHSHYWLKIQRPYILTIGEGEQDFKGIRDLSAIQTVRRN